MLWGTPIDSIYHSGANPPTAFPTNPMIYSAISGSIMPSVALLYTFRAQHCAAPLANA